MSTFTTVDNADQVQHMARRLGIVRDPADNQESFEKRVRKFAKVLEKDYRQLFSILRPLPSLNDIRLDIESKYQDTNDDQIEKMAKQAMDLMYAIRKFEICTMTFESKRCQLCDTSAITEGVYMRDQNKKAKFPENPRKFIYKKGDGTLAFLFPSEADVSMTKLAVTCQKCRNAVSGTNDDDFHFPMFSKEGGFNHGVPIPECLKNLSHVEQALISAIQSVMAARKLKQGMRCLKGHVDVMSYVVGNDNIPSEPDKRRIQPS